MICLCGPRIGVQRRNSRSRVFHHRDWVVCSGPSALKQCRHCAFSNFHLNRTICVGWAALSICRPDRHRIDTLGTATDSLQWRNDSPLNNNEMFAPCQILILCMKRTFVVVGVLVFGDCCDECRCPLTTFVDGDQGQKTSSCVLSHTHHVRVTRNEVCSRMRTVNICSHAFVACVVGAIQR